MNDYKLTIGLEIHAELNTKTKMFCNSKNDTNETRPNVNVCPVCMGHPGTLPVINREAIRSVLRLGVAVGGKIADYTEFDRKNYFYPDIPKGYQISQYKYPLVSGGEIAGVPLTRVHLEEDTARSLHDQNTKHNAQSTKNLDSGSWALGSSLLDFNRAGVPLMELVTEPAIHDAETAGRFAKEFQLLLLYLGISHANMEKGEMRIEANVSVRLADERGNKDTQIVADEENTDSRGLLYKDLTYKIRGAVFSVYNELGSGHKEIVYQRALEEEFKKLGLNYDREKNLGVNYKEVRVGSYQPDFVVADKIIIELKALPFIGKKEKEQLYSYLRNTSYKLGLLINFGSNPLQIERVIYDSIRDNLRPSALGTNPSTLISDSENLRKSASLGTKVEVKNLNSFKAVERAINYEYERQVALLEAGQEVVQETRGWDEGKQETFSQRAKEESHDYRYFPDPDLPKLYLREIPEFARDKLRESLPELPEEKRLRLGKLGIKPEHVEIYVNDFDKSNFFESVLDKLGSTDMADVISNYVITDLKRPVDVDNFAELMKMVGDEEISSRATKDILNIMQTEGGNPKTIAEEKNLMQLSDPAELKRLAQEVMSESPDAPVPFLVGQALKKSGGRANPKILNEILEDIHKTQVPKPK